MSATVKMEAPQMTAVARLTKDLRAASATLSKAEARFLVDYYYTAQDERIRAAAQVRSLVASGEPHATLAWLFDQSEMLETQIKAALHVYAKSDGVGRWALGVCGIGPVITAGLLAHIDIERAPTPGHIWRYAGLDPTAVWKEGQKRPWNAALKRLCWLIGESFVKVQNRDSDVYGKIYAERKASESVRNEAGDLAEQAATKLGKSRIGKDTQAYQHYRAGRLPPAHIHARAKRYAVKLFLSHFWEKSYEARYGATPPAPYAIAILGHAHKIEAPE